MNSIDESKTVQTMMDAVYSHFEGTESDFTDTSIHDEDEEISITEGETQETSTEVSSDRDKDSNSESDRDLRVVIPSDFQDQSA